jgi:hypothetical protein
MRLRISPFSMRKYLDEGPCALLDRRLRKKANAQNVRVSLFPKERRCATTRKAPPSIDHPRDRGGTAGAGADA